MWDGIFAEYQDAQNFELVDYIVCAMLRYVRARIISKQQTAVYKTLLHFPPVENVWVLVQSAITLRDQCLQQSSAKEKTKINSKKNTTLVDKAFKKLALAADDIARFAGGKPTRRAENEDYKRAYERIVLLHEALSKKVNEMVTDLGSIQID